MLAWIVCGSVFGVFLLSILTISVVLHRRDMNVDASYPD